MGEQRSVMVVGGGIGGMAAALALARRRIPVEIVEADPTWNAVGAGLTLHGGALRAFGRLGLLDPVLAAGYAATGPVHSCDAAGAVLVAGGTAPLFGDGVPNVGGILRPRLHAVMRAAIGEAGIRVRAGVRVEGLTEHADGVAVATSDGERAVHRFVIGADGLFSATRGAILPDAPRPRFTGQGCWRAVVPRPDDVTAPWIYSSGTSKAGFNPISDALMYVYLLESAPQKPRFEPAEWLPLLRQRLSRFGGHFRQIVAELDGEALINYRPLEVILVPPPWHVGHVLLIGDAAHATTPHVGYGAGLAIEDAVVLGEMAPGFGDDVAGLFAAFTARRFARCRTILEGSVAIGELEMASAPLAEQRALSARLGDTIRQPI